MNDFGKQVGRNKRAGNCGVCKALVALGAGFLYVRDVPGSRAVWTVKCAPCSGVPVVAALTTVEVRTFNGGEVSFKLVGAKLPSERFAEFRACVAGSKWSPALYANLLPSQKAANAVAQLAAKGFTLDVDAAARARIEGSQEQAKALVSSATNRLGDIDARLAARGKALFAFQRSGVAWLAPRTGALLSDEMGLGKTIQALAALPDNAPVLVICPAVAKGVWAREAAAWRPDYRVTTLSGRGSFRWPGKGEIVVINYDVLPGTTGTGANVVTEAPAAPEGTILVADEAHAAKSSKAARTVRVKALAQAIREAGGATWGLTATPLLNRPSELWTILSVFGLAREAFGSWDNFVTMLGGYRTRFGYEWGQIPDVDAVGERLSRVMLRRLRLAVLPDLPGKTHRFVPVTLDAKTARLCDAVLAELSAQGVTLAGLDQVVKNSAGGFSFTTMSQARAALAVAKSAAAVALVEDYEEQGEPVVVFSAHRAVIDSIGSREGWATITGDTDPADRTAIENAFQRGELKGVAATIKAGGVAITLTKAHHAIFVDQEWTPALNAQAEDRICRIGQDRGCVVTVLVGEHALDERVAELLAEKSVTISGSVDQAVAEGQSAPAFDAAPAVDFDALAQAADKARIEAEAARLEADRIRKEREEAAERLRKENEEKARNERSRERAKARGLIADEDAVRRGPMNAVEQWAFDGLAQLAALDPDRAAIENGVGFNKSDGSDGHWLSVEMRLGGLTDDQWARAIKLLRKYHNQIGECPDGRGEES